MNKHIVSPDESFVCDLPRDSVKKYKYHLEKRVCSIIPHSAIVVIYAN